MSHYTRSRSPSASGRGTPETIKANPGPARPFYFLARGGGKFTPLIAIDELPVHIKIHGINPSATFADIVDASGHPLMPAMERAAQCYAVSQTGDIEELDIAMDAVSLRSDATTASVNIPSRTALNQRLTRALDGVGSSTDPEALKKEILQLKSQKASSTGQRYNPTTPGVLGQKVYCTHWMRTGECDFTQQGCMFLHSMPDLDTLELLGFRSYPRWFREMPREYQVVNSKDFNEHGLNHHRISQRQLESCGMGNWNTNNNGNRYMPSRGGPGPRHGPSYNYSQQGSPQMMHSEYSGPPPQWQQGGQYPTPQGSPGPFYARPYTPMAGVQHQQPGYYQSIWSRDTSPTMNVVNRTHKPLTPEVTATYPPNMTVTAAPPPGLMPFPTQAFGSFIHDAENGAPRGGFANRALGRGVVAGGFNARATQADEKNADVGGIADKNPYDVLAVEGSPVKDEE